LHSSRHPLTSNISSRLPSRQGSGYEETTNSRIHSRFLPALLTFSPTLQPLIDVGFSIHVPDTPCYRVKEPCPPPTMYNEASFIAKFVEHLAGSSEGIVLVSHSYGGTPALESVKGLSMTER
jgi:pimeloyl-ACP methyl ester carboxylesterase